MFGKRSLLPVIILSVIALAACGSNGSQATGSGSAAKFNGTINIASSTWTGYAPLYLATAKNIWQKHGLNVNFTDVEDPVERLNALKAGRLDGMASTVDAFARAQSQGVQAVEIDEHEIRLLAHLQRADLLLQPQGACAVDGGHL